MPRLIRKTPAEQAASLRLFIHLPVPAGIEYGSANSRFSGRRSGRTARKLRKKTRAAVAARRPRKGRAGPSLSANDNVRSAKMGTIAGETFCRVVETSSLGLIQCGLLGSRASRAVKKLWNCPWKICRSSQTRRKRGIAAAHDRLGQKLEGGHRREGRQAAGPLELAEHGPVVVVPDGLLGRHPLAHAGWPAARAGAGRDCWTAASSSPEGRPCSGRRGPGRRASATDSAFSIGKAFLARKPLELGMTMANSSQTVKASRRLTLERRARTEQSRPKADMAAASKRRRQQDGRGLRGQGPAPRRRPGKRQDDQADQDRRAGGGPSRRGRR